MPLVYGYGVIAVIFDISMSSTSEKRGPGVW